MDSSLKKKQFLFDQLSSARGRWRAQNWYYYHKLERLMVSLIPPGRKVLEVGCGTGELLAGVAPGEGIGIDFSKKMLDIAAKQFQDLKFVCDNAECLQMHEPFDYVILSDLLGEVSDVWQVMHELHKVTDPNSRVIITYYNYLWEPLLKAGERLGMKMPQDYQNWLSPSDMAYALSQNSFEVVKRGTYLLLPIYVPVISEMVNRYLAPLPFLQRLCMVQYLVAKRQTSCKTETIPHYRVSVIVPCRNERENIENAVERIPMMGADTEIIFVDGESTDGTVEKIEEMISKYEGVKHIRLIHQTSEEARASSEHRPDKMLPLGKGDAVRKGFEAATGEVLMILDADLTVPPEELPRFYHAIASGKGEFINGSRLVYQMEKEAMRTLNLLGNKFFSIVFSWLLGQPIKDTLCGTKVLFRRDYEKIKSNRFFFGELDPFGDFDLLFGAAKRNLKIVEVPVHYRMRTYGDVKIERFKHGFKLLRMSLIGLWKLKFFK
ncbi:glycosyltransferase [Geotalea sp. SG265]|uniref:glycosyltransferase n=1 Tax=Geotalea sp. SG265 TaxID=2922867 RepID=UPI001FAFBA06|nr:glycosyltransferase [Geotalea sp. SG265]